VQSHLKEYDAAIKTLQRALELDPKFAQAQYNLGITYAARKDKRAALGLYATLKQLDAELGRKLFAEIFADKILDVSQK
jgi:tetratricopeptide (TPR) repeat protein